MKLLWPRHAFHRKSNLDSSLQMSNPGKVYNLYYLPYSSFTGAISPFSPWPKFSHLMPLKTLYHCCSTHEMLYRDFTQSLGWQEVIHHRVLHIVNKPGFPVKGNSSEAKVLAYHLRPPCTVACLSGSLTHPQDRGSLFC